MESKIWKKICTEVFIASLLKLANKVLNVHFHAYIAIHTF